MKLFKTLITSSARIPVVRNVANRFRGAVLSTTIRQNTSTANDPDRVLPFKKLPFNSAELDVENLPVNDTAEFGTRLWSTIAALKENKYTSVFLRVPLLYSHYIAVAGLYGFKYHHATGDVASLLLWLPASECKVPSYASHHLGVAGAVVIPNENDPTDRKLLVVREKSKLNDWKLPGGYSNLGEDFGDAAQREIFEETGIKSVFKSVLTLRNSHNIQFGCSDIYVICRMIIEDPKKIEITIDSEVDDAKWMSLKEFQMTAKNPMLKVVAKLLIEDSPGLTETTMASTVPNRSPYKLYHP